MPPPRSARRGLGWGYGVAVPVIRGGLTLLSRHDWRGTEHVPATGGAVVVPNHATYLDAVTASHFLWDGARRVPRYLAKASLWRVPVLGAVLRSARQIPVHRGGPDAASAYTSAVAAVRAGEVVLVFPEGTLTRDPHLWPMRAKTGAARIALATGCPVIPLGQWGADRVMPRYRRFPRPLPRRTIHVWAGPPVDLADLHSREDPEAVQEATDRIMAALVSIVADQRGEPAPVTLFDPRAEGVAETGRVSSRTSARRRAGRSRSPDG